MRTFCERANLFAILHPKSLGLAFSNFSSLFAEWRNSIKTGTLAPDLVQSSPLFSSATHGDQDSPLSVKRMMSHRFRNSVKTFFAPRLEDCQSRFFTPKDALIHEGIRYTTHRHIVSRDSYVQFWHQHAQRVGRIDTIFQYETPKGNIVLLAIQTYKALKPENAVHDPWARFPDFGGAMHQAAFHSDLRVITPDDLVGHVALISYTDDLLGGAIVSSVSLAKVCSSCGSLYWFKH